jgi:hypothetical protein
MFDRKLATHRVIATVRALVFGVLFSLAACTTTKPQPPGGQQQAQPQSWPLLAPATLGAAEQVKQLLRVAVGDKAFNVQCVVTVRGGRISIIGVTPLGLRAFSVDYDGSTVNETRAPQMPEFITGARLLNDIQFAFWPLAELTGALQGTGWTVGEPFPGTRRLLRDGRLYAEVHYADTQPWSGRIWLSNFQDRYSLSIVTSPLANP